MDDGAALTTKTSALRHYGIVMAFVVVGSALVLVAPYILVLVQNHAEVVSTNTDVTTATSQFKRSAPVRLQIPSIQLDTTFVPPLGLNADKTVSVPDNYTQVGWYSGGVSPGEIGPAVILGHVDSKTGPAVFYSLGQLRVGDGILVTRDDGTTVTFEVIELKRYLQSEFPTESVYGKTDESLLRLVTCTGVYSHNEQRYSHNLVVYARAK